MSQELNFGQEQCTLALLHMPTLCIETCKHLLDVRPVLLCSLAIYEQIVHVNYNTNVQQVC